MLPFAPGRHVSCAAMTSSLPPCLLIKVETRALMWEPKLAVFLLVSLGAAGLVIQYRLFQGFIASGGLQGDTSMAASTALRAPSLYLTHGGGYKPRIVQYRADGSTWRVQAAGRRQIRLQIYAINPSKHTCQLANVPACPRCLAAIKAPTLIPPAHPGTLLACRGALPSNWRTRPPVPDVFSQVLAVHPGAAPQGSPGHQRPLGGKGGLHHALSGPRTGSAAALPLPHHWLEQKLRPTQLTRSPSCSCLLAPPPLPPLPCRSVCPRSPLPPSPASSTTTQAFLRRLTSCSIPRPAAPSWQTACAPCWEPRGWSAAKTPSGVGTMVSG
jgi:hypothetical protein